MHEEPTASEHLIRRRGFEVHRDPITYTPRAIGPQLGMFSSSGLFLSAGEPL
jgi:hypothetical protein